MNRRNASLALALTIISSTAVASPQSDRQAVVTAVDTLLDAWRQADNAKADGVMHKEFRLFTLQGEGTERKVYVIDKAELLRESASVKPGEWDDHLKDLNVRIDPNGLSVVTARYLFNEDGKPTHYGQVAMQLYKEAGSWKILSFADTHNNLHGRPEAKVCPA